MAFLSSIIGLISQKMGDLVQALFGWSVTALFGQQAASKQVGLSIALALSALWPLFVLGTFLPGVAAWALAFLPLEEWFGKTVLRALWITLAVAAPLLVGAITRWAAPKKSTRGSALRTVLGGYSLTLGYAASVFVSVLTLPLFKLATMARGWTEEHAYVQPREGEYGAVLHRVAEAFHQAGLRPVIEDVPWSRSLAPRALKFFARGIVTPMMPEEPRLVRAGGVEVYLYPADLYLRGDERKVARVRTELMATSLDRHAYLVDSPKAQKLQEEVQRLWEVVLKHEREGRALGSMAASRVREMYADLRELNVKFEEWAMLERMIRKLERRVAGGPAIIADPSETFRVETEMEPALRSPVEAMA